MVTIVVPPVVAMKSRPSVFGVSLSISVRKKEPYDIELVQVLLFPFQNIYLLTLHTLHNISTFRHMDNRIKSVGIHLIKLLVGLNNNDGNIVSW